MGVMELNDRLKYSRTCMSFADDNAMEFMLLNLFKLSLRHIV